MPQPGLHRPNAAPAASAPTAWPRHLSDREAAGVGFPGRAGCPRRRPGSGSDV